MGSCRNKSGCAATNSGDKFTIFCYQASFVFSSYLTICPPVLKGISVSFWYGDQYVSLPLPPPAERMAAHRARTAAEVNCSRGTFQNRASSNAPATTNQTAGGW